MPDTTATPPKFVRQSLQVRVGSPEGLTPETHSAMLREARMQDWTMGQLLERLWAAYTRPAPVQLETPAPATASRKRAVAADRA